MKRSEDLEPLSHDHYEGLLVAARIRKGLEKAASPSTIAAYVSHFRDAHLAAHFRREEEFLPPLLAEIGASDLTARMMTEHRLIDRLISSAAEENVPEEAVRKLAEVSRVLKSHIRFEERDVFPALEERAQEEKLRYIGGKLRESHTEADPSWEPAFWG
jgi:iron-sulfur cluster repair protein YtfE (RIC family)